MRTINLIFFSAFLFITNNIYSQIGICGTFISSAQDNLEKTITITPLNPTQSLPQVNMNLAVVVYVVKDTNSIAIVSQSQINDAFNLLNSYFSPISLRFHSCNILNIENYQFGNLTQGQNENELTTYYSTPNFINLYIVEKITDKYSKSVKGFTYMPGDNKNSIFITKDNLISSEIAHQFGHFFNLYHTHEVYFGVELVGNIANCGTTGDLCCDTEADPMIAGFVNSINCAYTGQLKDSGNKFFVPSVKNIMSFADNNCRCNFSKHQYLRMVYALNNLKNSIK